MGGDQGAVHVDDQQSRQDLARDRQPREPACGLDLLPYVLPDPRSGLRDLHQGLVRGEVQDPADRRSGRRGPQHEGELVQDRDVGHRGGAHRDGDRRRYQHHAPAELRERPFLRQRCVKCGGQAAPVGELAQQDPARMPDEPGSVRGDRQGMVPPVILHGGERSCSLETA
jgi:hypothetical protein